MAFRDSHQRLLHRLRSLERGTLITLAVIAVLLVAARIALPFVVKQQVNKRLESIPGYWGHVEGIGISLIRGAYAMEDLAIYRVNGAAREPFVHARRIDFSVAWRELMHRKIVSDVIIDEPELNFVSAGTKEESQKDVDRRWQDVAKDLFPLEITHLEIKRGVVTYKDLTKKPAVDLFVKNFHVVATGLRNRSGEDGREFPADIAAEGETLGGGKLRLNIVADPLADQPHFHLSAKLDSVNLPDLNDSLKAVANVDVGRGTFELAAEMAGKDGGFQGYVKPFFENLDFHNLEDKNKGALTRVWEHVVSGLAWLVKNKARDQVGTRIPFQGRFGDPQVGLWRTVSNLFRHGFIRAFNPVVEGSLHADNVLPSGASADGKKVADTRDEGATARRNEVPDEQKAGAPTGRATGTTKKDSPSMKKAQQTEPKK